MSWQVGITGRQRWELAQLPFYKGLAFKGREEQRRLARMRKAFALTGPSEALVKYGRASRQMITDSTAYVVEVEEESIDFLNKILDLVELTPTSILILESLLSDLDALKEGGVWPVPPEAVAVDEASEDWNPEKLVDFIATNPGDFVQGMSELVTQATTWEEFRSSYLQAWNQKVGPVLEDA